MLRHERTLGLFFVDCEDAKAADKTIADFHGSIIGIDNVSVENSFDLVQSFSLTKARAVSDPDACLPPVSGPRAVEIVCVAPDNLGVLTAAGGSSAAPDATINIINELMDFV